MAASSLMTDHDHLSDLVVAVAALLAAFVGISKAMYEIGGARPWVRAIANFLQTMIGGWIGGAVYWDYGDHTNPGGFTVSVVVGAWLGAVLIDQLAKMALKRLVTGNGNGLPK